MALVSPGIVPASDLLLQNMIQDRALERMFHDAAFPQLKFRGEAYAERWEAQHGEVKVMSRSGLLDPEDSEILPGAEAGLAQQDFEQWFVKCRKAGKAINTDMAVSRTTLASKLLRDAKTLGLHAGQTLNRRARNALFCSYGVGHAVSRTAGVGVVALAVSSIAGFTEVLANGFPQTVSATNAKRFEINGVEQVEFIIAATPDDPAFPLGAGTLTISGAGVTVAVGDAIRAFDAPTIIRAGGGPSVDSIAAADTLSMADIRTATAEMRDNNIEPHPDGYYHLHLLPGGENQLGGDNELQRFHQGRPDDLYYRTAALGVAYGTVVYSNSEAPREGARSSGPQQTSRPVAAPLARLGGAISSEVINAAGVPIHRAIITGGGALSEYFVDPTELLSAAGVQGQVGEFNIMNNGFAVPIERAKYYIRGPQDNIGEQVTQSWSWLGGFSTPSDQLTGKNEARHKRAVVIEYSGAV